jgi:D-alanyl-D-alanine carboxypeptidase-like protein
VKLDTAAAYIRRQLQTGALTHYDLAKITERAQLAMGIEADGMPGLQTLSRLDSFFNPDDLTPTPVEVPIAAPDQVPGFDGPLERVPRNRADLIALLGHPGKVVADLAWVKANIVTVHDMPGVPSKWHFQIHRLIEPYGREGFRRAHIACPDYVIERAASFVHRHMRHDPTLDLSIHSWGAAIDVDPSLNEAATFKRGQEPVPFSQAWRVRWPKGLPQAFVEAFESVGFAWGGRWKVYVDPMHFEFVGRTDVQV